MRTLARIWTLLAAAVWAAGGGTLAAQESTTTNREPPPIAATVDGDPVYVAEIDTVLLNLRKSRQVSPAAINPTRAELLKQTINHRLVERILRRDGSYIDDADVEKAMEKVKTQAASRGQTLDQYVDKQRVSIDTLKHEVAWQLGWEKYLEANLGEALEAYFNAHRKELDGTQVRASHVILRAERVNQPPAQLIAAAQKIWDEIQSGKITFEQAVEKYSDGPSRRKQGDIGFFPRYGVMHEDFSKTAFALKPGEVGKPVVSPFGIHLIKVTEIKPGNKQWTEAASQLRNPAANELLEKLADQERATAKIEYTGKTPYFKPGTKELIVSGGTVSN